MQITSLAVRILNPSAISADKSLSGLADKDDPALKRSQEALDQVQQLQSRGTDDRKARAQQRLEQAKNQLRWLRMSGLPPEVIARLAASLAAELGAAAAEFASTVGAQSVGTGAAAVSAGATAAAATAAANADNSGAEAATEDAVASAETDPGAADETGDQTEDASSTADDKVAMPSAYRDVMEDADQSLDLSDSDSQALEEFRSLSRELKRVLQDAIGELRKRRQTGSNAQDALDSLGKFDTGMSAAGIFGTAASAPASFVI